MTTVSSTETLLAFSKSSRTPGMRLTKVKTVIDGCPWKFLFCALVKFGEYHPGLTPHWNWQLSLDYSGLNRPQHFKQLFWFY
jgi:hypothetical protein